MFQILDLSGSHYQLGQAQGAASERFAPPAWWPAPADPAFARECALIVSDLHPPLLDELHGYADAQKIPYADLLRSVCRPSMRLSARLPAYPEGGCSSVAAIGPDGHVRVGRNYDFYPLQRVRQQVRLHPDHGRPSLGMRGSLPGGRYDGVNDAGVFISLHVVLSDAPAQPRPGLPFHWLTRLALETCASAAAGVDLLLRVPHLHAFNYLLADAQGGLAVVEAHPERARSLPADEPHLAASNHFRHPDLAPLQRGRKLTHSQTRLDFLSNHAGQAEPAQLLADHASGLCGHRGGYTTLWSLAADLTARSIAYAPGAPCQTAFQPAVWPN